MPMPTTTAPAACSARIPASLPPQASTSFGHLRLASSPVSWRSAHAAATPASSGSQPRAAAGTSSGRSSKENVSAAPGLVCQALPCLPLPAVCDSAASTRPSAAPAAASRRTSVLVDGVAPTIRRSVHIVPAPSSASARASRSASSGAAEPFPVAAIMPVIVPRLHRPRIHTTAIRPRCPRRATTHGPSGLP